MSGRRQRQWSGGPPCARNDRGNLLDMGIALRSPCSAQARSGHPWPLVRRMRRTPRYGDHCSDRLLEGSDSREGFCKTIDIYIILPMAKLQQLREDLVAIMQRMDAT